jgi:hypothetical protein
MLRFSSHLKDFRGTREVVRRASGRRWFSVAGRGIAAALMLVSVVGCAGKEEVVGTPGMPLLPSLQVYTVNDEIGFVLHVTNVTPAAMELNFTSGQTYDFEIRDGGEVIWRWSEGQMFTQALRRERLAAGATMRFEASWRPAERIEGEYEAVGRLTSSDHPVEQAARITLP